LSAGGGGGGGADSSVVSFRPGECSPHNIQDSIGGTEAERRGPATSQCVVQAFAHITGIPPVLSGDHYIREEIFLGMLFLLRLAPRKRPEKVLYDLGCGDGRICIEAAESRGAKACGERTLRQQKLLGATKMLLGACLLQDRPDLDL